MKKINPFCIGMAGGAVKTLTTRGCNHAGLVRIRLFCYYCGKPIRKRCTSGKGGGAIKRTIVSNGVTKEIICHPACWNKDVKFKKENGEV